MKQEFNFARNIILSNVFRLKNPYKLTLALTYKCNSRCKICHIWKSKIKDELSLSELEIFFNRNTNFNWIDLIGGEVFIRKDIVPIIQSILSSQRNLYLLHIPTNGIMTKKIVKDVTAILKLKPKLFIISISLDGPQDVHDSLRGIKNNWTYAINTYMELKKLESSHFKIFFGMTLSKYNYLDIERTYREIRRAMPDFNRNSLHFNIAHNSSNFYANDDVKLGVNESIFEQLNIYNAKKSWNISPVLWLEKQYQSRILQYIKTKKSPLKCKALNSSLFIDSLGKVYPCLMWNKVLGNIRESDYILDKIWNNSNTTKTLGSIHNSKCPHCWTPCEAYQTILGNLIKK